MLPVQGMTTPVVVSLMLVRNEGPDVRPVALVAVTELAAPTVKLKLI